MHCLCNLLCSNSGEYRKQLFFGDGESSGDGAMVWIDKAKGERAVEEEEKGLLLCRSPAPFAPLLILDAVTHLSPCSEGLPVPLPCWSNLTSAPCLHHRLCTSYTWGKTKKQQRELETIFRAVLFEKPLPARVCD